MNDTYKYGFREIHWINVNLTVILSIKSPMVLDLFHGFCHVCTVAQKGQTVQQDVCPYVTCIKRPMDKCSHNMKKRWVKDLKTKLNVVKYPFHLKKLAEQAPKCTPSYEKPSLLTQKQSVIMQTKNMAFVSTNGVQASSF